MNLTEVPVVPVVPEVPVVSNTVPDWKSNTQYIIYDKVLYKGIIYSCMLSHISQGNWTPLNVPALWAKN